MTALETAVKAIEIFSARHPRPSHVTQRQAAEMLCRSEPTIRKMVRDGTFRLNRCGLIPIEQVDAALSANGRVEGRDAALSRRVPLERRVGRRGKCGERNGRRQRTDCAGRSYQAPA